jgi:hypothetical protein
MATIDMQSLPNYLREALEDAQDHIEQYVPKFQRNRENYAGRPLNELRRIERIFDEDNNGEERETYNRIRPMTRMEVANFFQVPDFIVLASDDTDAARLRAENSHQLLRHAYRTKRSLAFARYRARLLAAIDGMGWVKLFWNPLLARGRGDIDVEAINAASVPFDPTVTDPNNAAYVVHAKLIRRTRVEELYKQDIFGQRIAFEDAMFGGTKRSSNRFEYALQNNIISSSDINKLVQIYEIYFRPSEMFPNGAAFVYTGNQIVAAVTDEAGEPRLPYGRIPLIAFSGLNVLPDSPIPDGSIQDVAPIQRAMNALTNMAMEQAHLASNVSLITSGAVNISAMNNMNGQILEVEPGGVDPKYLIGPGPQNGLVAFKQTMDDQFRVTSGFSDASMGIAETGQANAKMLGVQDALARGILAPDVTMAQFDETEIAKTYLAIALEKYEEGRMIAVVGSNHVPSVRRFKPEQFDPDVDIVIDITAPPVQSEEFREAKAAELLGVGAFDDDPRSKRFRQYARRYSMLDNDDGLEKVDETIAREEHIAFETNGIMPPVLPEDDHECHMQIHRRYMVTSGRKLMPEQQQMLREHIIQHQQYAQLNFMDQQTLASGGGMAPPASPMDAAMGGGSAMTYGQPQGADDNTGMRGTESPASGGVSAFTDTGLPPAGT